MKWLNIVAARLRALLRREAVLQDIDKELRLHIEMETDANRELGMTPEEARLSAMKSFGNVGSIRDQAYEVRGGGFMETLWQDLRYGARMLVKHPGFTLIAVLTLSLGIGANTAIFSIVNAVLLRPFPYEAPEQLVIPGESNTGTRGNSSLSYPNFADWKDDRNVFASVSAVRSNENYNLTGSGEPERLIGRLVSAGFLSTLGIKPLLGRDLLAEDDRQGATPTVILSYGCVESQVRQRSKHSRQTDHAQQPELHSCRCYPAEFPVWAGCGRHYTHRTLSGTLQGTRRGSGNRRRRAFET